MSTLETTPEMRAILNDWLASAANVKYERASIGRALVRDVASLEAENAALKQERDAAMTLFRLRTADLGSVAAERDELKAQVEELNKGESREWVKSDALDKYAATLAERDRLRQALLLVLDQVDYTNGACELTEMVGAVLAQEVITRARSVLSPFEIEEGGR